jgi:hypothetical protein
LLDNRYRNPDGTYTLRRDGLVSMFVTDARLADESYSLDQDNVERYGTEGNGKFVMMTNVAAFDLKVFDPTAPIQDSDGVPGFPVGEPVTPGDPTFDLDNALNIPVTDRSRSLTVDEGAYVDLGWAATDYDPSHPFRSFGLQNLAGTNYPLLPHVYDTWSLHYEHDGVDQDNRGGVDQGTNGLDDVSSSGGKIDGVDDATERETSPSYPVPLQGIKVIIRVIEPGTRQVRQSAVVSEFVP